ncbi:hypothetical protein [Streptomyces lavendulae]|uniref:hypothetical protein n=1 Tax=Streptomyces lavendulae TaxID=1914 RepID=UPI0024A0BF15|nr:hypothetical protein [Streptomyces lavendulae]GLX22768.1 hypothetical protein Slala01_64120 [Streptomyces lavendulae subsp. lavendulae]GLX24295.1 hypothetical protein Slala02_01150 [Streptomyces lavendulae subsp. lavendulae]
MSAIPSTTERHRRTTSAAAPAPVRTAYALWLTAVAAGAFETVLAVGRMAADGTGSAGEIGTGLAVRLTVFTLAVLCARRMRGGARWARVVLALGLGVLGTASMVVQPLGYLAGGGSVVDALSRAGGLDLLFGASRALHVAAVPAAVALMFRPAANAYFRRAGR